MKIRKKPIVCSMIVLALCMGLCSVPVQAENTKKVRVGIYNEDEKYDLDSYQYRAAFDYDYLMEVAEHAGWDCEVVEGSLQECISGIENGTIDIMGNIEKGDGREDVMEFAEVPSMYVGHCLLIDAKTDSYNYEDFAAFDGMRIGTLKGCATEWELEVYSEENGFDYTLEWYNTDAELKKALTAHEIDCVYLSDFRNLEGYKRIAEFGNTPYYFALSKTRTDLRSELDLALKEIHTDSHYYENDLYAKYFTATVQDAFTAEEKEYLEKNNVIQVFLADGFPLICEYDSETQQYKGIIVDTLKKMSAKTGIQFEYQGMPENVIPGKYLREHPNTIMAPLLVNSLISYNGGIQKFETMMPEKMMGITREDERPDFNKEFKIVVPEGMYGVQEKLQKIYPKAEILFCKTHQDCLKYVAQGKADITLINEIAGSYMLQSPYYASLKQFQMEEFPEDISLGTSPDSDPLLISSLNKAILSLSERDIREILVANTASVSYKMSFMEWLYKNAVVLVLSGIIIVGLAAVIRWRNQRLKEKREDEEKSRITREHLELKLRYQEEMIYRAKYDGLTGLYNYQYFCAKSREVIDENPDTAYAFLYINVEQFKMINEVYGWRCGDMVLKKVADSIREKVGHSGIYARNYSDHFAVCYPVTGGKFDIKQMDTVMYQECEEHRIRIQVSIGIYLDDEHDRDVSRCMEYAQIALQNGRKAGKGYIHYYHTEYMESLKKSQKFTNEMEKALADGQFEIFLQPQFDQIAGTLVGAEALVRWKHPEEGLLSPSKFIPVFEKNGFIGKLDAYVCEEACKLLAKWKKQGIMVPISVNLTRSDLLDDTTLPLLVGLLDKYELPVECLHIEITESVYEESQEELIHVVECFKEKGFVLEMDDFGSSYSSLNMLKNIPIDIIKMDMKFFEGESVRNKGGTIVKAVVKLAHSLGVPVVAEGVETERDAMFLRRINCHLVQGYLYGRPTEVEAFEKLMETSSIGEKRLHINTGALG